MVIHAPESHHRRVTHLLWSLCHLHSLLVVDQELRATTPLSALGKNWQIRRTDLILHFTFHVPEPFDYAMPEHRTISHKQLSPHSTLFTKSHGTRKDESTCDTLHPQHPFPLSAEYVHVFYFLLNLSF
jgi:hypothetical protein